MYGALFLDLTEYLLLDPLDSLLTFVFLARDHLFDESSILLLLRHHRIVDYLLLLLQLLLQYLCPRSVGRSLQVLFGLMRCLLSLTRLLLIGLNLVVEIRVKLVWLLDLSKVGHQLLLFLRQIGIRLLIIVIVICGSGLWLIIG